MFSVVFVLVFSFVVLIPEGKTYREQRQELKKENHELEKYQEFNNETLERLKKLQSDNKHIIAAFKTPFNPEKFEKQNRVYFSSLTISPQARAENEENFTVYEVNTTSKINSPAVFYEFLEAINKSDWIIGVNFPISFKRETDMIRSSFTMRVYTHENEPSTQKDSVALTNPHASENAHVASDPHATKKTEESHSKGSH